MASHGQVFQLSCAVQSYAWGKLGKTSEVANLSSAGNTGFVLKDDTPYAELWMGTHPKGPAVMLPSQKLLSTWIAENPTCLGEKVNDTFGSMVAGQLPFLFKVLSVGKSLSIQAHPHKKHAESLHKEKPDKYPDANHKPEMAIALTHFQAMCGFRPKSEILTFITGVPELAAIMGRTLVTALQEADDEEAVQEAVKRCFTALMMCEPQQVEKQLTTLVQRLSAAKTGGEDLAVSQGELFLRLHSEFPGDVGCFCIYFLNVLELEPGQAIFLEANLPHAYLAGDCIECMACSDNVVRAGLTPKYKDVEVLCSMLNYDCQPAENNFFKGKKDPSSPEVTIFDPPVPDFTVAKIQLESDTERYTLAAVDSASILLVVEGRAVVDSSDPQLPLSRGTVLFIAANTGVDLKLERTGMLMFRAFCSL